MNNAPVFQTRVASWRGSFGAALGGHCLVAGMLIALAMAPVLGQTGKAADLAGEDQLVVPATVKGLYSTGIMSRMEGYVGKVRVDIGDSVKKGDVLLVINAPEINLNVSRHQRLVEKAKADVAAVEAELVSMGASVAAIEARERLRQSERARIGRLVDSGAITDAKRDEAQYALDAVLSEKKMLAAETTAVRARLTASKAGVHVARAELAHAEAMRDYLAVKAPFDGIVTKRDVDPGAYVRPPSGPAKPLLQLESIDRMRLVIMVPYASADRLEIGGRVTFSGLRGKAEMVISGNVTRTGFAFEEGSRMMRAEVELENRPHPATGKRPLRSGDYGSATIVLEGNESASVQRRQFVPAASQIQESFPAPGESSTIWIRTTLRCDGIG